MIAVSSPYFSTLDFAEALDRIASEFSAWEIVAEGSHALPDIEGKFLELTPSYDLAFSAHAPMSDINIGSLNPRMREASLRELIGGLGACSRLGIEVYTIHPGFLSPVGLAARDRVKDAVMRSLKRIDALSEETGVQVALENMPRSPFSMCQEPAELDELLEGTGIGICFDTGHANTTENIDAFLRLAGRFRNVHVHDNRGERDEHLPVGEGSINFPRLLDGLDGYRGRLVIESRGWEDAVVSKRNLEKLLP